LTLHSSSANARQIRAPFRARLYRPEGRLQSTMRWFQRLIVARLAGAKFRLRFDKVPCGS